MSLTRSDLRIFDRDDQDHILVIAQTDRGRDFLFEHYEEGDYDDRGALRVSRLVDRQLIARARHDGVTVG